MVLSSKEIEFLNSRIKIRRDDFLEITSRISPKRRERHIFRYAEKGEKGICIFCKENLRRYVKIEINGKIYRRGESIIFYNKYPFASHHLVGLLCEKHNLEMSEFSKEMFENLLLLTREYYKDEGLDNFYVYFNMNFSPEAGASQQHPHVQIYIEDAKSTLHRTIEKNKNLFAMWLEQHKEKGLLINKKDIKYIFNYAPLGNNNITIHLPFSSSKEMLRLKSIKLLSNGIINIIHLYDTLNERCFNFSIFPTKIGTFGFFITRNQARERYVNDRGFMETILREIVVNTDPKEISKAFNSFLREHEA